MSTNGNMVSINKGMFVIIVILVAIIIMFATNMLFLYKRDVMKNCDSNGGNVVSKGISFEDKIVLDGIIGTGNSGLGFLLGKDSINNIDNNDISKYDYYKDTSEFYDRLTISIFC